MSGSINFDDMEYAAPLRQFDLRTESERRSDELATLRSDLVMVLAMIQDFNRRLAVVEQRLEDRAQASARPRSDAATAIAAFLRKQGISSNEAQRSALQSAPPSAVADTLSEEGYGSYTASEIADAMATWAEVYP